MAFWSDGTSSPKLSFRWQLQIGDPQIKFFAIRSFQKPTFSIGVSEYININDIGYRPGLLSWNPTEITFVVPEEESEDTESLLYEIVKKGGYILGDAGDQDKPTSAIEKAKITAALGNQIVLTQYNAGGEALDEWMLQNPFVTQINFGQSNYGSDELLVVTMTVQYDHAYYKRA
jgi:hypothetical protein